VSVSINVCECVHAQTFVACLLVVNFGINIVETEIPDMSRETSNTFDSIDHAFTIFYVLELMLNLFVNWFWPFVTNGWSLFDTLAVTMSVIGALLNTIDPGHSNNDLSVIRSVRMYVTLECMLHSVYSCLAIRIKEKVQIPVFFHNLAFVKNVFFTSLVDWNEKFHVGSLDIKILPNDGQNFKSFNIGNSIFFMVRHLWQVPWQN
jgi:hypothetical protein